MNWYQVDIKKTFRELSVSDAGLTEKEAKERLAHYGPNKLAEEKKVSRLRIIMGQFTSPLIYILLIAAIVTAVFREYVDTGVIISVVLLNALIGYLQEYKAEESVKALQKMVVLKARVFRDGMEKEIHIEWLQTGIIAMAVIIAVAVDKAIRKSRRGVETLGRTDFGVCDLPE